MHSLCGHMHIRIRARALLVGVAAACARVDMHSCMRAALGPSEHAHARATLQEALATAAAGGASGGGGSSTAPEGTTGAPAAVAVAAVPQRLGLWSATPPSAPPSGDIAEADMVSALTAVAVKTGSLEQLLGAVRLLLFGRGALVAPDAAGAARAVDCGGVVKVGAALADIARALVVRCADDMDGWHGEPIGHVFSCGPRGAGGGGGDASATALPLVRVQQGMDEKVPACVRGSRARRARRRAGSREGRGVRFAGHGPHHRGRGRVLGQRRFLFPGACQTAGASRAGREAIVCAHVQLPLQHSARDIACGEAHVLCCTAAGVVFAWGNGANGRLGLGDTSDHSSAVQVYGLADTLFVAVACGAAHSMALSSEGELWSW